MTQDIEPEFRRRKVKMDSGRGQIRIINASPRVGRRIQSRKRLRGSQCSRSLSRHQLARLTVGRNEAASISFNAHVNQQYRLLIGPR